jgi:hypothetical protein
MSALDVAASEYKPPKPSAQPALSSNNASTTRSRPANNTESGAVYPKENALTCSA